jgi:transposase
LTDGWCRPLVIAVTPGQAGDSTQLTRLLDELQVDRSTGRPRTTPAALRADKAYSSKAIRAMLRRRGITAVIPALRS